MKFLFPQFSLALPEANQSKDEILNKAMTFVISANQLQNSRRWQINTRDFSRAWPRLHATSSGSFFLEFWLVDFASNISCQWLALIAKVSLLLQSIRA